MSERTFTRWSWGSFVALVAVLHVVGSCSGASDGDAAGTEPDPVAATAASTTRAPVPATTADTEPAVEAAPFVLPAGNPDQLAAWNQLEVRDGRLVLLDGVTPYVLNSALFSDYALKLRTVWIPEGAPAARYDPERSFDFPVGTVVTKTFYYPEPDGVAPEDGVVVRADQTADVVESLDLDDFRLVETRVLVHRADGWHGFPYVWDAEETGAALQRTGDLQSLSLIDNGTELPITYLVPDVNQCASCHATNHSTGAIQTIGLQARHLNTGVDLGNGFASQLDQWRELGLLTGAPAADEIPSAAVWDDDEVPLENRARAYLDINCAHCHNPVGAADTSGLFLDPSTEVGFSYGVCKPPVAAGTGTGGRLVDIFPGEPDESILVHRMETIDPGAMMPELGRSISHSEGVDVVAEWIASLQGNC